LNLKVRASKRLNVAGIIPIPCKTFSKTLFSNFLMFLFLLWCSVIFLYV
jgi:hypothetical protein